ncbi:hypothetical protein [Schleiferilactobacillus harbinensis]|jgi:hypothetical protein|uniref:hypothetical protein n=1 Tax=Schleiferilactobacillus harbinensis TaxID=304207 RepID=UPI0039EABD79
MQVDNTTNYAVQELSMRLGNMAIRAGILHQEVDELKRANELLKKQVASYKDKGKGSEQENATDHQSGLDKQRGQSK